MRFVCFFFWGSRLSPSKTSASCKMQNAKGGGNSRRGKGYIQHAASCQGTTQYMLGRRDPLQSVDSAGKMLPGNGFRWGWQREKEGREGQADSQLRLLAACRHPKPFTIDTRLWPLKVTSVKRAFFSSYLSLFFKVGGVVQAVFIFPLPLSAHSKGGANELQCGKYVYVQQVKTSLESQQ